MAEIKVLIKGYAKKEKYGWTASPSTVLIQDNGLNILVDPGANLRLLLNALAKNNLKPGNISLIFLTHYHMDHLLNIRLFPAVDILDGSTIYQQDKEISYSNKIPKTNIYVIPTPGHTKDHTSLLIEASNGKIAVAGDLFWWADTEKQNTDYNRLIKKKDAFAEDEAALMASRKHILSLADYIIPGHGKMFAVKK